LRPIKKALEAGSLICGFLYIYMAEVLGAGQVDLQPAEHLLFNKQFPKMCPSALSVLDPPDPRGEGGGGQTEPKHSLEEWECE